MSRTNRGEMVVIGAAVLLVTAADDSKRVAEDGVAFYEEHPATFPFQASTLCRLTMPGITAIIVHEGQEKATDFLMAR